MSGSNERLNEALVEVVRDKKISSSIRLKKAKYFIGLGANVNTKMFGKSVLSMALDNADTELARYLEIKGGKEWEISKEEAETLGKKFLELDMGDIKDVEMIKSLIKQGAEVNIKSSKVSSVLRRAICCEQIDIVSLLLKRGVDVNAQYENGATALMSASICKNKKMVDMLLEKGAIIDVRDNYGKTALMWAAIYGKSDIVKTLIEKGGDIEVKDNEGMTALMWGACEGHKNVVEVLLEKGVKVDVKDKRGETALEMARQRMKEDVVEVLEKVSKSKKDKKIGTEAETVIGFRHRTEQV